MNLDFFKKKKYVYLIIFGLVKKLVFILFLLMNKLTAVSNKI